MRPAAILIAALIGLPMPAGATVRHRYHVYTMKTVQANRGWQKTRFTLHGDGVLRFAARGRWVFNPSQPAVDGDGAQNLSTAGRISYTFSGSEGREGQLIGKIGHRKPFVAGAHGTHRVKRGEMGSLYLMINDDVKQSAGSGLTDNGGHLTVRVEFERRVLGRNRSRLHRRF